MQISQRSRNRAFWLLQLGGWGALNLLSLLVLKDAGTRFLVFSVVTGILSGILGTTPIRYFLRNRITFDGFGWKDVSLVLLAILGGSFLYGLLNFLAGMGFVALFKEEDNELIKNIIKVYNSFWLLVINSAIMIAIWVICYLAIKLLLKLNANRLERLELNATLKQAQLNTLKGQINPHFMFNSLNNIRGLMLEDVGRSREMLTKLSEMLRYSLTQNDINASTLERELEIVDNYIDLSKIQFEERLQFRKDIDPATLSIDIPPMIIQLLVENAVKHGISNRKEGGEILLRTWIKEGHLWIETSNDGTLALGGDTTQLGLKNIRQRLKLLYGKAADFRLYQQGDTVLAEVKIPIP